MLDSRGSAAFRSALASRQIRVASGIVLLVTMITLGWHDALLPSFPIELSKIANHSPARELFVCGTVWMALLTVANLSPVMPDMVRVLTIFSAGCLVMLGIFSDAHHLAIHMTAAAGFFVSAAVVTALQHGLTPRGVAPLVFFGVRTLLAPLQHYAAFTGDAATMLFWQTVRAPFQWLTVFALRIGLV
jgi:hypothetical protein